MPPRQRSNLVIDPLPARSPEIGQWLWALEDTRRNTLKGVQTLRGDSSSIIDWVPPAGGNSIGALLYHIALVEASWLFEEVVQQELPADLKAFFPFDSRDENQRLVRAAGFSLDAHAMRLERVRKTLINVYREMDVDDYRRARALPDYDVSPEWVLYHLIEHENEHRGQILIVRNAFNDSR